VNAYMLLKTRGSVDLNGRNPATLEIARMIAKL